MWEIVFPLYLQLGGDAAEKRQMLVPAPRETTIAGRLEEMAVGWKSDLGCKVIIKYSIFSYLYIFPSFFSLLFFFFFLPLFTSSVDCCVL